MFKKLFALTFRLAPISTLPWFTTSPLNCFFWGGPKLQKNKIDNRAFIKVQISNAPCQDRNDIRQLQSIGGYAAAVYDGHGGWQVSHLCSEKLLKILDQVLLKNKGKFSSDEDLISQSIKQAFLEIEKEYLAIAMLSYRYGFGRAGRAGSCALVCVVHNNKVYCGNAGDSLALIVKQDNPMGFIQLNRELNANNPEQQQRLRELFPNQQDIVVCKKDNNKSCYIKGRLQPSRSIGDFRLKYAQFNNPNNYSAQMEYQSPLKNFSGNYITPLPEITVTPITSEHKYIVMASDGLWDQLGRQEVAQLFRKIAAKEAPQALIEKSLEKASQSSKLSVGQIRSRPAGKKRRIHDDITVIVIDLSRQSQ